MRSSPKEVRAAAPESYDRVEIQKNKGDRPMEPVAALRIMVVEDEAIVATLLAEVLEGMGHEVCAIEATEAEAVRTAVGCRPDLMIVDALLGLGSGVAAVEQILRTWLVPHLFVSGDLSRVRKLRPSAVMLQKPFRESDLASAIQRALGAAALSSGT
jgi:CheY-like chemotaxis protein